MTNYKQLVRIVFFLIISLLSGHGILLAQEAGFKFSGKILESGTSIPIQQAVVSVGSTSESTITDSTGSFTVTLPTAFDKIMVSYLAILPLNFIQKITRTLQFILLKCNTEVSMQNIQSLWGLLTKVEQQMRLV